MLTKSTPAPPELFVLKYEFPGYWDTKSDPVPVLNTGLPAWFVQVYEMDRLYGGPEEGGWWFDTGELVAQFVCRSQAEAVQLRDHLLENDYRNDGYDRYSMAYIGGEYEINIDTKPGVKSFPEKRPHYE